MNFVTSLAYHLTSAWLRLQHSRNLGTTFWPSSGIATTIGGGALIYRVHRRIWPESGGEEEKEEEGTFGEQVTLVKLRNCYGRN